ncbi:ribonuclease HII [Rubrobacter tropicus]|uniref:Ribonuclease n=1 Tax=Rubrobacter tropicus TaxID=2653851 RepID=A0A6G8Q8Y9_9ACTN|nr:ribonuclease HII [Rubrobacter tropicus]QIN82955.1 ribonuclease HII [Rubrobacter tropicus]
MRAAPGTARRPDAAPLYAFDAAWTLDRGGPLAGADEAGRGALAGPLVAAAVVLGETQLSEVNDSKTLRAGRREAVFADVLRRAEAVSVVAFPAWWIDRHGVGRANREALTRVIEALRSRARCALADGNLKLGPDVECLPRADTRSAAVAAASVVAKVLRDGAMRELASTHSAYGFERHAGYGTEHHRAALARYGPCRVHRLSYAGVLG